MGRKLFTLMLVILIYIMGGFGVTERLDNSNLSSSYYNINETDTTNRNNYLSIEGIAQSYISDSNTSSSTASSGYIDNINGANDGIHLNEAMVNAVVPNQIVWLLNRLIEDRRIVEAESISNPISTPESTKVATFVPFNPVSTPIPTVESTKTPFIWILQATATPYTPVLIATDVPVLIPTATDVPTIDSEVTVIKVTLIEKTKTPTRSNTSTVTSVPEIIIENTIEPISTSIQIEPTSTPTGIVVLVTAYTTNTPEPTNTNFSEISNTDTPTPERQLVVTSTWTPESVSTPTPLIDWNATPPTVLPTLTFRPTYTPEFTPTPYPTNSPLPTLTIRPTLTRLP